MLKTVEEILKESDGKIPSVPPINFCCKCQDALRASINGCRDTKLGPMCDDCYFKMMSDHYDENPITPPPYTE